MERARDHRGARGQAGAGSQPPERRDPGAKASPKPRRRGADVDQLADDTGLDHDELKEVLKQATNEGQVAWLGGDVTDRLKRVG